MASKDKSDNGNVDTDDTVVVSEVSSDNAVLLLAAAEELGLDPSVVTVSGGEGFSAPRAVAEKAGLAPDEEPEPDQGSPDSGDNEGRE